MEVAVSARAPLPARIISALLALAGVLTIFTTDDGTSLLLLFAIVLGIFLFANVAATGFLPLLQRFERRIEPRFWILENFGYRAARIYVIVAGIAVSVAVVLLGTLASLLLWLLGSSLGTVILVAFLSIATLCYWLQATLWMMRMIGTAGPA